MNDIIVALYEQYRGYNIHFSRDIGGRYYFYCWFLQDKKHKERFAVAMSPAEAATKFMKGFLANPDRDQIT